MSYKNQKINFHRFGRGPVIILIHGWTNNWRGMIPLIKYLKKSFTLIAIDLPGFGDSSPLSTYSLKIQAKAVSHFIKSQNISPLAILGHSMGAHVVSQISVDYPQISEKFILVSPTLPQLLHPHLNQLELRFLRLISRYRFSSLLIKNIISQDLYAAFIAKFFNMYRFNREIIKKYGSEGPKKLTPLAYVHMGIAIFSTDLTKLLATSSVPYLVIYGSHDKLTKASDFEKYFNHRPNFKIVSIPRAGHIVTVEQPQLVARAIKSYLNSPVGRSCPAAAGLQTII